MIETTVMNVDQKAEAVLQDTSVIAEDIIEKGKEECLFIAQNISDTLSKEGVTSTDSTEKLQQLEKVVGLRNETQLLVLSKIIKFAILTQCR
jgi:hypothetical protein